VRAHGRIVPSKFGCGRAPDFGHRCRHLDLQARLSVAMHFGTFRLTDEARDEPPQQLGEALDARGVPRDRFRVPRPGQTLTAPS
jgi:L-ascorbate metabolism protein UlaG (beta-lactamase superfamily)